jgi:AcrR family transcriptional regulator
MGMASTPRRSAGDWVDVAYARFRDEGFDGLRVEALARDLGATKGSFYWHFADRAALVTAVMERWEREETDTFIEEADQAPDPRTRLRVLFNAVGRRSMPGEHRLYADAVAEGVGLVVKRVTARRVGYVAAALVELGFTRDEARRRAVASVAIVLGLEQLRRGGAAAVFGSGSELGESVLRMLLAPLPEPPAG